MSRLQTLMRIKRSNGGYIAILLCICVPVLLIGVKHVIDTVSLHTSMLTKSSGKLHKKCAKEAALEVAKKWNSGLTLKQQKESMLRIADGVYNSHPAYHDSVVGNSIPGLDIVDIKAERSGKMYNPLGVKSTVNTATNSRVVEYKQVAYNKQRIKFYYPNDKSTANVSLLEPYRRLYFLIKKPYAILEDPCWDFVSYTNSVGANQNTYSFSSFYVGADQSSNIAMNYVAGIGVSSVGAFYTARVSENDDKVQLSIDRDKIKVITDDDIGYAIPAECNVDIVLSIPVNGAACNKDNYDSSSTTAGSPTVITADTVGINDSATLAARSDVKDMRSTPIYQVAQAYRRFLHDNFKYTRGVNIGVIPYSGKLSIPPDKGTIWTKSIPNFISTYFLSDQNTYQAYIRGGFLYSTPGTKGSSLTAGYGNWGEYGASAISGGYGIMYRGKTTAESTYGNNEMCIGDLLSTTNPTSYKFRRVNYNPCYLGHANFLSMKCDSDCTKYYHNPYFVTELMSDVEKVYDLLNAIVPINDPKNVSNFVFLPITWANNLFQSWTNDPKKDAVNTSGSSAGGQLSHQSKSTSGRKKVLILLVNKPDYFEHGELTYLGFNNDFSEIPLIESDCIRFDIDYSDTTRKFADGTQYNGTIQGAKKILKYETVNGTVARNSSSGYYESSGSAAGKLSFPQKYLLKIVVEPLNKFEWNNIGNVLSNATGQSNWYQIAYNGNTWMALSESGYIATSTDAITWKNRGKILQASDWRSIAYGNNIWIAITHSGIAFTSSDGILWSQKTPLRNIGWDAWYDIQYGGDMWFATNYWASRGFSTDNGNNWNFLQDTGIYFGARTDFSVTYYNGKWFIVSNKGSIKMSPDGHSWTNIGNKLSLIESSGWNRIFGTDKYCIALNGSGNTAISVDGKNWVALDKLNASSVWRGLWYGDAKFVTCNYDGTIAIGKEEQKGQLQFTNINPSSNGGVTSNAYEVTDKQEFYIEPSQISSGSDGNYYINFNMKNIRLISAEITNRPYKKITPTCSLSGTTSGTGTAYITTNVKKSLTLKTRALGKGTVTFSNINDSTINNIGTHNLTKETTTFNFPKSNFSNNYTDKKIAYTLQGGTISNIILQNQVIRFYSNGTNFKYDAPHINISIAQYGGSYWSAVNLSNANNSESKISFFNELQKFSLEWCMIRRQYDGIYGASPGARFFFNNTEVGFVGRENDISTGFISVGMVYTTRAAMNDKNWLKNIYTLDDDKVSSFEKLTTNYFTIRIDHSLYYYSIAESNRLLYFYINNKNTVDLSSNANNKISYDSEFIYFYGAGELQVTVQLLQGAIQYTTASNTTDSVTEEIYNTEYEAISITPEEYYYEPQANGTYRITLKLNNVQITDLQLVDTTPVIEYMKIRLPEMSRVVDFTKNISGAPEYDKSLISKLTLSKLSYNSDIGHWTTSQNNYPYSEFFNGNILGDFYFLIEDIGTISPEIRFFNRSRGPNTFSSTKCEIYNLEGLHRRYQDYDDTRRVEMASFDWVNAHSGGHGKYWHTGFTYPVNTALYYGAYETTLNKYKWQINADGTINSDPNASCERVTTSACAKLKQDWGNNLRIYIVKYRKQNQYKHPVLGSKVNFSYGYLDDCASGRDYIYDVSDENGLKSTLEIIANDIKTFAGYYDAKNVN